MTFLSCASTDRRTGLHFTSLPASVTGIGFANTITENDSLNMFVNEYTYMGGGVGVGDFNRDGLPDLFFSGNQVSSRLYLNKGGMHFEDITQKAGVSTDTWCTGVSVVDINNDGWPDIYVCVSGKGPGKRRNLLFINQHDLTFKEEAAQYGLDDSVFSTQAVFFDYDGDGRLDMYLVNHTLNDMQPNDIRERKVDSNAIAGDRLYHNEGTPAGMDHPVFKDVSRKAGIVEDGNGLGVVVDDFNGDGYPDIYVCNDYIRNDLLWMNNGNGTFTNCIGSALRHQSYSSMGTDAADINNDGLPDLMTLDMQPETNERKKMMYSFLNNQRHQLEMDKGYEQQYIHNMLQINNGVRTVDGRWDGVRMVDGRREPFFSEIAEMAGLAETDWSWSVLIADFDNDGWKDVHITNGLGRDPTNIDFLEYAHNTVLETGIPENEMGQRRKFMAKLAERGPLMLRNYLFRNKGGLQFEDISDSAGIGGASISNGAVYADLDNDGKLDLVTNNINGPAFVLHNETKGGHYLTLRLEGDSMNKEGIGAVVKAYSGGMEQMVEQNPVRGYLSTVDERLHFGCAGGIVDSLRVTWPGGKTQVLVRPPVDTMLVLKYRNAGVGGADPVAAPVADTAAAAGAMFTDVTEKIRADFRHKETFFFDYKFQPLLLQKYSQEGPFISAGDMNGDGLEDFFIGGAFEQPGKVFLQRKDGTFEGKDLVAGPKHEEDMQSVLFDANGDGRPDLLVVGGSSEFDDHSSFYIPRLYLNDGKGNFHKDSLAFSTFIRTAAKCVAPGDMDGDGDQDLFIGGRVSLGSYPNPPQSYLLRNDHGRFVDVTASVCPALQYVGMVNAAVWADVDGDGKPDLIVAADWKPIRVFRNNGRTMTEITDQAGLGGLTGFWRTLTVADVNGDGKPDLIAGNLGLNNPWHIDTARPAELVSKDFDGNGIADPVLCYYIRGEDGEYRLQVGVGRDNWAMQMPSIKRRYDDNAKYAKASMDEIFTPEMMTGALVLHCNEVRSGWFENDGHGKFSFHPFPLVAQEAPVNAIVYADVNGDGKADLILGGNEYEASVMTGRYDASYGLVLAGDGKGGWTGVPPAKSGLILDGDVRDLKVIRVAEMPVLLVGVNDSKMKAFRIMAPKDPPVAATMGFFLDDWQPKRWVAPDRMDIGAQKTGDVTVTVDASNVITKIPSSVYGHNANTWMTAMITEPDFMRHVGDLHPHVIRWPAGSGSDGYWWDRAPGNQPDDVPMMLMDKGGKKKAPGYFYGRPPGARSGSLDAYYEMRRETGNEGLITVNYGYARYGTGPHPVETAAHYAADWVRYDHGRTRYWEVGNENYGDWELGYRIDTTQNKDGQPEFLTGQLYAKHFKVFADSMRRAAAELGVKIYIGAVTAEMPPMNYDTKTRKNWNPEMMKELDGAADYYVVHNYFTPYRKNSTAAEVLHDAETVPEEQMKYVLESLSAAGAAVKPIAMDEWNMFASGSMQQVSNTSGLFADIVIGETLRNRYGLACRWDMLNAWDGGNDHGLFSAGDEAGVAKWSPRPSFYHLYYLQKMQGDRLVDAVSSDTSIRAYGSTFSSGEVNVTLVNVSPQTRMVQLDVKGYEGDRRGYGLGKRYYWYTLSHGKDNAEFSRQVFVNGRGPSGLAGGPDDYATIPAWSAPTEGGVAVTVPAYGAVFLTIGDK
ncbi:MAG TPA: FG-GAP-like repeat-containing protein [Puia sp.]|nr:FG-GAP-like repeat-containing protein [Puia sp.]